MDSIAAHQGNRIIKHPVVPYVGPFAAFIALADWLPVSPGFLYPMRPVLEGYTRGAYQRTCSRKALRNCQPLAQYHLGLSSLKAAHKEGARKALTRAIGPSGSFAERGRIEKGSLTDSVVQERQVPPSATLAQALPTVMPMCSLLHTEPLAM